MRIQHAELEKKLAEGQSRLDSLRQVVGTGERPRQVVGKSVMEGIRRLLAALEHLPLEEDESSEQVKATREAMEDLQEVLWHHVSMHLRKSSWRRASAIWKTRST